VETLMVVLVDAQGNFGGHFTQGRRWEKYMYLNYGLVEKEDEEVEKGG
jgi:hypothetical protein